MFRYWTHTFGKSARFQCASHSTKRVDLKSNARSELKLWHFFVNSGFLLIFILLGFAACIVHWQSSTENLKLCPISRMPELLVLILAPHAVSNSATNPFASMWTSDCIITSISLLSLLSVLFGICVPHVRFNSIRSARFSVPSNT